MTTEALAPLRSRRLQLPVFLVSLGHGATHWIAATFYLILPFIKRDLGLSYAEAGFLVTCFYLGSTAANLPSGSAVDLTGKRVLFQAVALVAGSLGLLALGLVTPYYGLALLAVVIGASNMLWHPAAIAYLSGHFPRNRGYALSMHALGANLGDAVAPIFAGWLLLSRSWESTAMVNSVTGILCAGLILALLGRSDEGAVAAAKQLDIGAYFRSLGQVLKRRAIWSLCLMAGFRSMMQSGLLVFLPLYLANELKVNPFWMGFTLMLLQLGGVVATPIAGTLSDRIGRRPVVLAGMFGTTALIVALSLISNAIVFVFCIAVLGFCMYAMRPVIHSWLMDGSPPHLAATMTSAMFGTQAGLSALAPLIGGLLADRYGLVSVFYFLAATVLVANALAFAVPRTERLT